MQANRFEQVSEVQPDAITLSLSRSATGEVGAVILPAVASGGRLSEDKISGELPAIDLFRSAIKLANEMKLAIVVMDPEGVWKKEWGELYTPVTTDLFERRERIARLAENQCRTDAARFTSRRNRSQLPAANRTRTAPA